MTVRAAGGRRTGCATPSHREQQQQQQHSGCQASIGAVVGCDRVSLWGCERCDGLQKLFRSSNPIRASRRKGRLFRRDACADRIARSKRFLKPTAFLTTPQNTRSLHTAPTMAPILAWLATASAAAAVAAQTRVSVAHPILRPPAARTVIRWQQCVLSMTFLKHR